MAFIDVLYLRWGVSALWRHPQRVSEVSYQRENISRFDKEWKRWSQGHCLLELESHRTLKLHWLRMRIRPSGGDCHRSIVQTNQSSGLSLQKAWVAHGDSLGSKVILSEVSSMVNDVKVSYNRIIDIYSAFSISYILSSRRSPLWYSLTVPIKKNMFSFNLKTYYPDCWIGDLERAD